MRIFVIAFVALFFISNLSFAQAPRPKRFTAPLAGKVVLSEVEDKYNANVYSMEMPKPDAPEDHKRLKEIKEQINRDFPHKKKPQQKKTSAVMAPILGINFVADTLSGIPPDNYNAVSKNYIATAVMNDNITIHDAITGAYIVRKSLLPFSASVGLNNTMTSSPNYRFDPKIIYDPEADRFICVMLNSTNNLNWIVLGFSQSNDPTGTWNFYKFYGDYMNDTTWFDYPAVSITKNEFFLTGNKIKYNTSWQAGFTQTLIYQVRKQDGYDGDTILNYQIWDSIQHNNKSLRCLYPVKPGDAIGGPGQYFLSNRNFDITNDSVFLVHVPDTIGSATSTLGITPLVSSLPYGVPPNARQKDTSITLATNDGRVLGGYMKDDQIQFVSTSLDPAYGSSAVYHGVINNVSTAPVLTGQLFSIDSLDFGYPNISYAGVAGGPNHSIISFEYSGPRTFAGFGAILYDGTGYSDMTVIRAGDTTIKLLPYKEQRWGDYSASQPDWKVPGTVWVNGIYGRSLRRYGNYMAQLISPYHTGVNVTPTRTGPVAKLYPNPALEYISFEFTVLKEQVFSFHIYDAQGRLVDKVLDNLCHEGKNVLKFNIAPLAPGTYFLRSAGTQGENLPVYTFQRK